MEHRTTFNVEDSLNLTTFSLEDSLNLWKKELAKSSVMTTENIEELESHLRDEMDELTLTGLSLEEAFIIAKKRIGSANTLTREFYKVNRKYHLKSKLMPYLQGILLLLVFQSAQNIIQSVSALVGSYFDMSAYYISYISPGIELLLLVSGLLFFFRGNKYKKLSILKSTPLLISFVLLIKISEFALGVNASRLVNPRTFGLLRYNHIILDLLLLSLLLAISGHLFYSIRKNNTKQFQNG